MANPKLPIQAGNNLPMQDREDEIHDAKDQDAEMEAFEDALGLDEDEVEQEVIENDDGSVIVNFTPKSSPKESPEFYANLADVFDQDDLNELANEYLDYIDVDRESRKQRDKQYEEGLRRIVYQIGRAHV